jgi:hypothetical protein
MRRSPSEGKSPDAALSTSLKKFPESIYGETFWLYTVALESAKPGAWAGEVE